jgi:hypothetical protein
MVNLQTDIRCEVAMKKQQDIVKENSIPPSVQLFKIAIGFMKAQAIYVAAKLGIADLLRDGPKKVEELANAVGVHGNSLYRLLRALAGIGIFAEKEDGSFELTPMASALQSDVPMSLRPYILLLGDKSWWEPWSNLLYSVKTGAPAFDHMFGMGYSEFLEKHPDADKIFNECMTSVSQAHNPAIVGCYDFSRFRKIVDVGGGHGSLLTAILKANPGVSGVLCDLPHIVDSIDKLDVELSGRCEIAAGDFFEEVPAGGDAYVLKQIIHDWNDERSITILKNCYKVMTEDGRVLVIEGMIEAGNTPSIFKLFDLHMLVTAPGGKERTESEFRSLFNGAGFELSKIIPTPSSFCIIEGYRK